MADISGYPRTDLNSTVAPVDAGTRWDAGAKSFRCVKVEDKALVAGDVVELSDTTGTEVTSDRAGGSSLGRGAVAGVALAAVANGSYGVIQTGGVALVSVATAAVGAAGGLLVPHATADGQVSIATTSTLRYAFAVALGNATATTSGAGLAYAKIISAL